MANLRELTEKDLSITLTGKDWRIPVQITSPDGSKLSPDVNGNYIYGQVLYDRVSVSPETGEEMIVKEPIIVLRRSDLSQVPKPGENWHFRIPKDPKQDPATVTWSDFVMSKDRSPEGGQSIGFIRIYLQLFEQS